MGEIKKCAMSHLCGVTHLGLSHFLGSKHRSPPPIARESMDCALGGIIRVLELGKFDYSGCSIVLDMI